MKKIPVILDTDIGGDIDDTWALGMLLKSPELDLKLITRDTGNTEYRAKICAKFLERAWRGDIPVGIGIMQDSDGPRERQSAWVRDYKFENYRGKMFKDGVDAIIECIDKSTSPVTLICIGPVPNIAEALRRRPDIAGKTNFVGMFGSIRKQHMGKAGAIAECNVVSDIVSCQTVFKAPWKSMTITPLDTCGIVKLQGSLYKKIAESKDAMVQAIIENHHIWLKSGGINEKETESSILFDTVAVHLAYSTEFLKMEKMRIGINDSGFTVIDERAPLINVAIDWLDLDGYHEYLAERLLSEAVI
jgi:inosine-uridine nucleoside N-ribohydrolase